MARECAITGKKKKSGNIVTHSHKKIKNIFQTKLKKS